MKVSVAVTTYNHGDFISEALDSILMQEAAFDYEIVVGEDYSNDGTRDVVRKYHALHPHRIKVVLPERNLGEGGKAIFRDTLELCNGEYIATMDGDDYWTSPQKLQKQVKFLDNNQDCSMCFHDALIRHMNKTDDMKRFVGHRAKDVYDIADLFAGCFVPSCSPMFRREALIPLPTWYFDLPTGDWSLYVAALEAGRIGYLDEVLGVRRIHSSGMWSALDEVNQLNMMLKQYYALDTATGGKYRGHVKASQAQVYASLSTEYARRGKISTSITYAVKGILMDRRVIGPNRRNIIMRVTKNYIRFITNWARKVRWR